MAEAASPAFWQLLQDPATRRQLVAQWLHHAAADGRGVKIAVIDTGMDERLLQQRNEKLGRPFQAIEGAIFQASHATPLPYQGQQSAPHGTTVADIIWSIAPAAQLYSADIFGPRGVAELEALVQAIYYAVEHWGCHILNISLGVTEQRLQTPARRQQLLRAVEDCYHRGVLIVAAAHNDHPATRSYPALFAPPLLSVTAHTFVDPLHVAFQGGQAIEFKASSIGHFGPFASQPSTSWAAPHVTGLAARFLSRQPQLRPFEVKTLLYWWATEP
jgi:subtilisin family serine protease